MLYFNNCYSCFNPILFYLKNKDFFYYSCLLGNIEEERTGHGSDHILGSDFTSMFLKRDCMIRKPSPEPCALKVREGHLHGHGGLENPEKARK